MEFRNLTPFVSLSSDMVFCGVQSFKHSVGKTPVWAAPSYAWGGWGALPYFDLRYSRMHERIQLFDLTGRRAHYPSWREMFRRRVRSREPDYFASTPYRGQFILGG